MAGAFPSHKQESEGDNAVIALDWEQGSIMSQGPYTARTKKEGEPLPDPSAVASIRLATIADAQAIAEIQICSWQWAYRDLLPQDYLDHMATTLSTRIEARRTELESVPKAQRWWIAEYMQQIAGFALSGPSRDPDAVPATAEIYALYLSPEATGKGIGRALFSHAVEDLRQRGYEQATLWVLEGNARARRFYETAGWMPDGMSKIVERPGAVLHEVRYVTVL